MSNNNEQGASQTLNSALADLDEDSYTALRLRHATPQHLYLTARRLFIGPIPEGWLKSHRKSWYKHHLHIGGYSSRQATFRPSHELSWARRLSGLDQNLDGEGRPARQQQFRQSFPQPRDLEDNDVEASDERGVTRTVGAAESMERQEEHELVEHDEEPTDVEEEEATTTVPPAIEIPRSANTDENVPQRDRSKGESEPILEPARPLDGPERETSSGPEAIHANQLPGRIHAEQRTKGALGGDTADEAPLDVESNLSGLNTNDQLLPRTSLVASSRLSDRPDESASTSALIQSESTAGVRKDDQRPGSSAKKVLGKVKASISRASDKPCDGDQYFQNGAPEPMADPTKRQSHIRFLPEDTQLRDKARKSQIVLRRGSLGLLKGDMAEGQIIRMERMLVRVDATPEKKLPSDYDENSSQGVISRVEERWREYLVVCRRSSSSPDAECALLMYKTRVIRSIDKSDYRKHATYAIPLGKKVCGVNLYSALDKTVVLWTPGPRGTKIYILRPRSSANSVEWCTFLRSILGLRRTAELHINVPDLSIQLRIAHPFQELEALNDSRDATDDENANAEALDEEHLISQKIIHKCLHMLEGSPEYQDVIAAWAKGERMGLAWKRYDRLEWIHGVQEQKMYGTMAMMKSHELELRPKEHYPTMTTTRKGHHLTEPPPVEGFLIRLTSRKGLHQRFGRLFIKRLYFSTHDRYLVFSRPAKADPPPPPKMPATENGKVPKAQQISNKIPIIYAVNPYPIQNGQVAWLLTNGERHETVKRRDKDAYDEMLRKYSIMQNCDGFIDLCSVAKVRNIHIGATPADDDIDEGSDVDFDIDIPDSTTDDGATTAIDREKTFELLLSNGLVIRLQAFDGETKGEWVKRLRELVRYWKYRHAQDIDLYKSTRRANLDSLHIDEEAEAIVGQFARKWEVTRTYASPELYNMCGISCCRTVHLSGPLYRKPRRRSLFTSTHCILIPGRMLVFASTLRTTTGKSIPHIHHERVDSMDLTDCYIYSGLLTENDLLYQNRTFDSNNPGHNALPRMWLEDNWTSRDEDIMTCFVIWRPTSKSWFRRPGIDQNDEVAEGGEKKKGLARVSQLGVKGRTVVFKARSRAERDHWVLAIATEIGRLQGGEDVRLVGVKPNKRKDQKASNGSVV